MFRKGFPYLVLCAVFLMQPRTHAFSGANLFRNVMTGLHGYVLAVPLIGWLKSQYVAYKTIIALPDASPEINEHVKAILRKHNCPDNIVDNVQIKIGEHFQAQYNFYGKHIITILKEFETELKIELAAEALIRHEAAHLEHKDMLRMGAFLVLSTVLVHYLLNGIAYPIGYLLQPYTPAVLQSLMKLPLALSKAMVVLMTQVIFAKYKEYSADKRAADAIKDPVILRAMEDVFMKTYERYERDQKLDPKDRESCLRFLLDEMLTPDSCHPNYLLRSHIFADAAKKLEQNSYITTERVS